ncbi:MAG: hypothetical protein LBP55_03615 [Candidatus Adiutrix sp.]|jgi:hypothetical protein|nr:hypothetical protein [Candidatus Adiutrix sp.]
MREWITGQKVMKDYGLSAAGLGEHCYSGKLTAYIAEIEKPIYELSKIQRVPEYPPPGVDPHDHIQSGEEVRWDWDDILKVKPIRLKLANIKWALGQLMAAWEEKNPHTLLGRMGKGYGQDIPGLWIPPYNEDNYFKDYSFDELTRLKSAWEIKCRQLDLEIRELTDPNFEAIVAAEGFREEYPNLNFDTYGYAWKTIMPVFWRVLIDGQPFNSEDIKGQLFFFNFDMFERDIKSLYANDGIIEAYKTYLARMWFDKAEVEKLLIKDPPAQAAQDSPLESAPSSDGRVGQGDNVEIDLAAWEEAIKQDEKDAPRKNYARPRRLRTYIDVKIRKAESSTNKNNFTNDLKKIQGDIDYMMKKYPNLRPLRK